MIVWPRVVTALVDGLSPLVGPDVKVYNGNTLEGDAPLAYITVGWQPATDEQAAGDFTQTVGVDGFAAAESGTVLLEMAAVTGDTVVPDVFALASTVTAWVQANQTLGGALSVNGTAVLSASVVEPQNHSGSAQRLLATLTYTTEVS